MPKVWRSSSRWFGVRCLARASNSRGVYSLTVYRQRPARRLAFVNPLRRLNLVVQMCQNSFPVPDRRSSAFQISNRFRPPHRPLARPLQKVGLSQIPSKCPLRASGSHAVRWSSNSNPITSLLLAFAATSSLSHASYLWGVLLLYCTSVNKTLSILTFYMFVYFSFVIGHSRSCSKARRLSAKLRWCSISRE